MHGPPDTEEVPGGHGVHTPPALELKHAGQRTHVVRVASDEEPAGQEKHMPLPGDVEKLPAGQSKQVLPAAKLPAGQGVQAAAPACEMLPALQAAQLAPPPGEAVPDAQAWQLQPAGSLPGAQLVVHGVMVG